MTAIMVSGILIGNRRSLTAFGMTMPAVSTPISQKQDMGHPARDDKSELIAQDDHSVKMAIQWRDELRTQVPKRPRGCRAAGEWRRRSWSCRAGHRRGRTRG